MDPESLPPLYVIYSNNPSNSGRVHSDVRKRWLAGDVRVQHDMDIIADFARIGRYPHIWSLTWTLQPIKC
jgi:glucuronokinase